jgi:geranylgeranyl reductase
MEIAIIGGGPAGALAAGKLARAGRDVTLFHDDARPEKPCGGGVPWRGLMTAPVLLDESLPRKVVPHLQVVAPSGRTAELELERPLHVFSRALLDRFLRDKAVEAGARLVPLHVRRIETGPGGAFLLTDTTGERHRFRRIAGADGTDSLVRRTFLGPRRKAALSQALGWYIRGVTDDTIVLRFESGLMGYQWLFPRPDHLAVGICSPLGAAPAADLWGRCGRFLEELPDGLAGEPAQRVRYAALIPAPEFDRRGRMLVEGDGWALLGDAAGAVDPLTREGIHYALESASLWADAVLNPDGGTYAERFHAAFPRELIWARQRMERFFDPAFTERVVRYAERSAAIRRVLSDLLAGTQPYTTLKRRLVKAVLPLGISLLGSRLQSGRPAGSSRGAPRQRSMSRQGGPAPPPGITFRQGGRNP